MNQLSHLNGAGRAPPAYEPPEYVPPSRALTALRRRKWLILAVTALLVAPACFVIAGLTPYYDSEATILIDTRKSSFSDLQAMAPSTTADAVALRTQVDIIRSPVIAAAVADRLDLQHVEEFRRVLDAGPSLPQRVRHFVATLSSQEPSRPRTGAERRQATIALLRDKLTVSNDGRTYIISLRVRTGDPDLSTRVVNAYAGAYLDFSLQGKTAAVTRSSKLLDAQIAPLRDRVREAENAVESFRGNNGRVLNRAAGSQDGQASTVASQQLAQVSSQLTVAAGDVAQKSASLRAVQGAQSGGAGLYAVPEVVASPLIQRLREQESQLSSREASLSQTALPGNPSVQGAKASLADVRRRIDQEIAKIVAGLSNEVIAAKARREALEGRLAQLQSQVTTQSQANVTLRQLEGEAEAAKAVYSDYLKRFEQTSNQAALQETEASLISPAQAPLGPAGPPRVQLAALAGIAGFGLGALLALGMERLRGGIRTAEQLQAETGLTPLGFLPVTSPTRAALADARPSVYTECVTLVRSMLLHGDEPVRARVVIVTSALTQEGKTFFAVSLAASAARGTKRALLIDCDARRPSVAAVLDLRGPTPGAASPGPERTILWPDVLPGLDVVTFRASPDERMAPLGVEQLSRLLDEVRDRYGMIVIDTPPVLAFADAPLLAPLADGAIMVVRWQRTSSASVLSALRALRAYGVRVVGGVLTQVSVRELAQSDGDHGETYRNQLDYLR